MNYPIHILHSVCSFFPYSVTNTVLSYTSYLQHARLIRTYGQTGAGQIPEHERLTEIEMLALDYAGEEAVIGRF